MFLEFSEFQLSEIILRNIEELGYAQPTHVQSQAIPAALEGRNLLVTAETGSGKTAAFLLPMIQRLQAEGRRAGKIRGLVMCPTREIASQTVEFAQALADGTGVQSASIYGGVAFGPQEQAFRSGVEIIVATPGRLLDHISRGNAKFDALSFLVIDEADRLMDMGFMPDLQRVLGFLPKQRQTMLFSATMPDEIMSLVRRIMSDPLRVEVGQLAMPPATVEQVVYPVAQERKTDLLIYLLRGKSGEKMETVLVFCRTKRRAERLAQQLTRARLNVTAIHGDRSQSQRETALAGFRSGEFRVLVATDVAARGLDIEAISHVVNYDLPEVAEVYVHRIGRTARAGATGRAYSFVTPEDRANLTRIEQALGQRLERFTITDFSYNRGEDSGGAPPPGSGVRVVASTASTTRTMRSGGASPVANWRRP
ncbi:MAG: DEAD/DEAH box helicase [Bacillota bacterium]|nr:DEAD/DEAH box helicase [Bacillota bacterium]